MGVLLAKKIKTRGSPKYDASVRMYRHGVESGAVACLRHDGLKERI